MTRASENRVVRLPDGRRLSYSVWGPERGPAIVLMHGWPGCRLLGLQFAAVAQAKAICLVIPDRPGIGRSEPCKGRRLLDWPGDVKVLGEALGIDRFAVVGYSGGAPYALACANRLSEFITGVAVVSGLGPLDSSEAMAVLPRHVQAMFSICRVVPEAARMPAAFMAVAARYVPRFAAFQSRLVCASSDRDVLAREHVVKNMRMEYIEAFRQGVNHVAEEVSIFARPWGFPLQGLPKGIRLYHGEEDRFVPVALARLVARALPGCRCRFISGAGHFWIIDHFGEVIDDLLSNVD